MRAQQTIGLLLALALLAPAAGVAAQGTRRQRTEARNIASGASEHYNLGRFDEALAEYSRAYEVYPAAPLLFNIGQCHRELGNHERVVFFFERFLEESPYASNAETVRELLSESQAEIDRARTAADAHEQAEAQARIDAAREAEMERQRLRTTREEAARLEREREANDPVNQWWLWTIVGVLAAGLVAGGVTLGIVLSSELPGGSLGTIDAR